MHTADSNLHREYARASDGKWSEMYWMWSIEASVYSDIHAQPHVAPTKIAKVTIWTCANVLYVLAYIYLISYLFRGGASGNIWMSFKPYMQPLNKTNVNFLSSSIQFSVFLKNFVFYASISIRHNDMDVEHRIFDCSEMSSSMATWKKNVNKCKLSALFLLQFTSALQNNRMLYIKPDLNELRHFATVFFIFFVLCALERCRNH